MKAAIFKEPHAPLSVEDVPPPTIQPDEVLVKVAACGVCHTDLHYIDHGVPTFKPPPIILGHECSGVIAEVGAEVEQWRPGDRVLLPAVLSCGSCRMCRLGRENICERMAMFGNHRDGAYAEYVAAPAKDIFRLPENVPLAESSIIADALSTPYHAVKNRARVQPGDRVVVFGCGGVGINVVQMAVAAGAQVVAVDVKDEKLELARQLGAWATINPQTVDVKKEVRRLFDGGADIAIEAIGHPATIEQAFDCARTGGRLCVVGYTDQMAGLNAARLMFREMEIVGSLGCRPVDYPAIIQLVAQGRIRVEPVVTHRFPLAEINQALDVLRRGDGLRSIITFQ
ncbi:MAG: alcohol dehydrogenase [Acidobacteria bacterium]|nr:MAG: alcohol dehydrogenase [Acidobacteriota bacterium]